MKQAQLVSIVVYALFAWCHVAPWLKQRRLAEALTALLWIHVFRYCVVYIYVAQREGYPISDVAAAELVIGDLVGAILAVIAIALLHWRWRLGLTMSWLVIVETIVDFLAGVYLRNIEPPRADASGVWWLVFVYFAPLVLISLPLMAWQLYARWNEPFPDGKPIAGSLA
jgi:hypothetical protein